MDIKRTSQREIWNCFNISETRNCTEIWNVTKCTRKREISTKAWGAVNLKQRHVSLEWKQNACTAALTFTHIHATHHICSIIILSRPLSESSFVFNFGNVDALNTYSLSRSLYSHAYINATRKPSKIQFIFNVAEWTSRDFCA